MTTAKVHWMCSQHKDKCCGCYPHEECTRAAIVVACEDESNPNKLWCGEGNGSIIDVTGVSAINVFLSKKKPWRINK